MTDASTQASRRGAPSASAPQGAPVIRYGAIPDDAYAVVADLQARPGMVDELRAATLPLVAAVRGEPGAIAYFLHEDRNVPGRFVFYEMFRSLEDLEAHREAPHVQAWFARLPELARGEVIVTHLRLLANIPKPEQTS